MFGVLSFIFDKLYTVAPSLLMLTVYFIFQWWRERNEEPYDESIGPLNVNNTKEWMFLMEGMVCIYVHIYYQCTLKHDPPNISSS